MSSGRLGRQLGVAFALVAAATGLLAMVILGGVWQRQFEGYVRVNLQDRADGLAQALAASYAQAGGWRDAEFADLSHVGMMNGLRVQVYDASGVLLVDNAPAVSGMMGMMRERFPGLTGEPRGPVAVAPVRVGDAEVGRVRLASITGELLTGRDVEFRSASLRGLLVAALLATLLATAAGLAYSGVLIGPINAITRTAAALRAGDRSARTGMARDDEVGMLGRTLDGMADAIEADREFERRLTADVAHELRTPLMAIQATVEAMQDGVLPSDPERLGVLRDETVRLARLTDSLLELSRLERGEVAFSLERVDLAEPVGAALEAHRALIEASGLRLAEGLDEGVLVAADRDRLTQAVGNLLSNAVRYTPAPGSVTVRVRQDGDRGVVSVTDTGVGIREEDRDKIFRRFWRAEPGAVVAPADDAAGAGDPHGQGGESGGVGIGLAIVREIIERHGGSVHVGPGPGGTGTEFELRLPRQ